MSSSHNQTMVSKMMEMGFHISNNGFKYILDAVEVIHNINRIKMTGKGGVYDTVAYANNTTAIRVERCIRTEIERYYNTNTNIPAMLAGDKDSGKLTNSEFLSRMTCILYSDNREY